MSEDDTAWQHLVWIRHTINNMTVQPEALTEAIKVLAEAKGANPDAVTKVVGDAVAAKLVTLKLEITTEQR